MWSLHMPAVAHAARDSRGQEDCSNVDMHRDDECHGGASAPETDADTSAGEYLATDDRTKAHGYNRLPIVPPAGHPAAGLTTGSGGARGTIPRERRERARDRSRSSRGG